MAFKYGRPAFTDPSKLEREAKEKAQRQSTAAIVQEATLFVSTLDFDLIAPMIKDLTISEIRTWLRERKIRTSDDSIAVTADIIMSRTVQWIHDVEDCKLAAQDAINAETEAQEKKRAELEAYETVPGFGSF